MEYVTGNKSGGCFYFSTPSIAKQIKTELNGNEFKKVNNMQPLEHLLLNSEYSIEYISLYFNYDFFKKNIYHFIIYYQIMR